MEQAAFLIQVVQLCLGSDKTLVIPAIEAANFLTNLCDIGAGDIFLRTETERSHLVFQGAQVSGYLMLQSVVTVTIGQRELETTILQRCSIHGH